MNFDAKRFFTVAEAERLIPRLEALMREAMDAHTEASAIRGGLAEAQRRVMLAGGARLDQEFWRSRRAQLERTTAEIRARIGEVVGLGAVPKDLEMGLVDFPCVMEEREVNLCWRLGERRIRFWHALDEGYAARKPLPGAPGES